jgi:hypothetical protein
MTYALLLLLLLLLLSCAALVAWRSRRSTAIRLSAPFIFLALALIVTLALNINFGLRERFVAVLPGQENPKLIQSIPACGSDVYIAGRECLDFLYTPAGDPVVEVSLPCYYAVKNRCLVDLCISIFQCAGLGRAVALALNFNFVLRERFLAVLPGQETPTLIQSIPACGRDVYIAGRECLDFPYTAADDPVVEVGLPCWIMQPKVTCLFDFEIRGF